MSVSLAKYPASVNAARTKAAGYMHRITTLPINVAVRRETPVALACAHPDLYDGTRSFIMFGDKPTAERFANTLVDADSQWTITRWVTISDYIDFSTEAAEGGHLCWREVSYFNM